MSHVFQNFRFVILRTTNDNTSDIISDLLFSNGCQEVHVLDSNSLQVKLEECISQLNKFEIDFIITENLPNDILKLSLKAMIPTVKTQWIKACIKNERIVPVEPYQFISTILQNEKIYISRYSFNEQETHFLRNIVLLLGGYVTPILSMNSITHVLVKNEEIDIDPVTKVFQTLSKNIKHPPIEDENWLFNKYSQGYSNNDIIESVDTSDRFNIDELERIFTGFEFIIDLQMDVKLTSQLCLMIERLGGKISSTSKRKYEHINKIDEERTIYLGEYFGNELFDIKIKRKYNLEWFFDCLFQNTFIQTLNNPMYQIPIKKQSQLLSGMKIGYSQIFGLQRYKVITTIESLGASASPNVSLGTDLLIIGISQGNKYNFALKHNIPIVKLQWLNDCQRDEFLHPYNQYRSFTGIGTVDSSETPIVPLNLNQKLERERSILETQLSDANVLKSAADLDILKSRQTSPQRTDSIVITSSTESEIVSDSEIESQKIEHPFKDNIPSKQHASFNDRSIEQESVNATRDIDNIDTNPDTENIPLKKSDRILSSRPRTKIFLEETPTDTIQSTTYNTANNEFNLESENKADIESLISDSPKEELSVADIEVEVPTKREAAGPSRRTAKRRRTDDKISTILSSSIDTSDGIKPLYDIHCVISQCLEKINEMDKELLKSLGITIYDEITDENMEMLNSIIAPKRLRTVKFLFSLSFKPLKYTLLPKFITDLLKRVHANHKSDNKKMSKSKNLDIHLDPQQYAIPDISPEILSLTRLPNKVFARYGISRVNISTSMPGGTETLKTILHQHGIEVVNVLPRHFELKDIVPNNIATTDVPRYILITNQVSQMKSFKKVLGDIGAKVLIVKWNWCVQSIFNLQVSYEEKDTNVMYYEG